MATIVEVKFNFNEEKVKEKIAKLEASAKELGGKRGYNPYLWMQEHLNPLTYKFNNQKDRSEELYNSFMKLPDVIPPIIVYPPEPEVKKVKI